MTYSEKLRDRRWQKKRLEVFARDNWTCQREGCKSSEYSPLAVHHKCYNPGCEPWQYDPVDLITYCDECHTLEHATTRGRLVEGHTYSWNELGHRLQFQPDPYLTERNGRIVCACVTQEYNPNAPDILLPGDYPDIVAKAQLFAGQENYVPVLVKGTESEWNYCGYYRVEAMTTNANEISMHQRCHKLQKVPISMVLFLEKKP